MSETEDYSSLSLEERATHKVWKVRLAAYGELTELFTKSPNVNAPCFQDYGQPDLFKNIVTDSNVVSQEAGIQCLCNILEFGGDKLSIKLRNVISPMCEKSFVSARAGTRLKATELLMLFIEYSSPDPVIEQVLPFLSHKIPKVATAATRAITDILTQFGCKTCSPKLIIPILPKLFAHADKNVRLEATNLSLEIYKWMGPSFEQLIFNDLKPVQQKDLKLAFDNITDKPVQLRFLQSQKEVAVAEVVADNEDGDVEMHDDNVEKELSTLDPYDMADPVDVLSHLPNDFYGRVAALKWSERKEVLEELLKIVSVLKIEDLNFNDLIRCLSKSIGKDANIQVATVAAQCVENIAKGLRHGFDKYVNIVLPALLDRTKEKKQSVADALASALDAVFANSSFSHVVDDITKYLSNKTPQVKIATAHFLTRCLQTTKVAPTRQEYETFLPSAVKLLSDSQEPVRSAASSVIGTLMKITGERELNGYFDKIDENRMSKVKECFENAVISVVVTKAKPKPTVAKPTVLGKVARNGVSSRLSQIARPSLSYNNSRQPITLRKVDDSNTKLKLTLGNSIPTKRMATSPLKLDPLKPTSRLNNVGRSLTSTTLNSSNSPLIITRELPSLEKEELELLRLEKLSWLKEREHFQWKINDNTTREERLLEEISELRGKVNDLMEDHTRDVIKIKSKETQLTRLESDLTNARQKIQSYESNHLTREFIPERTSPIRTKYISPFEDPTPGSDLSSKVKRLSIDNKDKENDTPQLDFTRSKIEMELDNNDDSWRRAAEVTSQLKARIEKMKARSRTNVSSFESRR